MGVDLRLAARLADQIDRDWNRLALPVPARPDALRNRHHAAAVLPVNAVDVGQKAVDGERALRQVEEMGAVVVVPAGQRGGGRQPAGVSAHDHGDVDAQQGAIVGVGPPERAGDEAGGRGIAGAMVVDGQIVVDRFRDMDGPQLVAFPLGVLGDDPHRVGGIVAADVEEVANLALLEDVEDALAVLFVRLVPGRAQRGRGRSGHPFQVVGGRLGQIDEGFFDDAPHAVAGAPDPSDFREFARFQHRPHQALVDHRRGAATLGHHDLAFQSAHTPSQYR